MRDSLHCLEEELEYVGQGEIGVSPGQGEERREIAIRTQLRLNQIDQRGIRGI